MTLNYLRFVVAVAIVVGSSTLAAAELEAVDWRSGIFGGSDVTFSFRVKGKPAGHDVKWSYLANGRTIRRGEVPIKGGVASIELKVPPATDGVIVKTELNVQLVKRGAKDPVDEVSKPISPRSPTAHRASS